MTLDRTTIQSYDQHPRAYLAATGTPGFWGKPWSWLKEQLPLPARILEVGSGHGRDAAMILADGYDYTGIEPSASLAALSRERVPGIRVVEADLRSDPRDYASGGSPFDGLWCVAVLMHLTREELPAGLDNLRYMVKPGAPGVIAIKTKPGNPADGWETRNDMPSPRWYTWWDRGEFAGVLEAHGFTVVEYGHETGWFIFYVRAS